MIEKGDSPAGAAIAGSRTGRHKGAEEILTTFNATAFI